jgi:hypothetical protein
MGSAGAVLCYSLLIANTHVPIPWNAKTASKNITLWKKAQQEVRQHWFITEYIAVKTFKQYYFNHCQWFLNFLLGRSCYIFTHEKASNFCSLYWKLLVQLQKKSRIPQVPILMSIRNRWKLYEEICE